MSSRLTEKIREIREAETSGRGEFSQLIGIPKKTLENIELTGRAPKGEMLEAICRQWPKYTLWLMTDQVDEAAGQISPEIERARQTLKKTGTDTESRDG
ncbi:helix-turn-helix transcriptional regulator [Salinicola sp. RZ23]|uniref:helix-turn-helix domain-containing protein n=1 Tax=Salinicola sp. RZ23 TaxID=1949087 RepID=UPI0013001BB5|nr:helix-turn-helix transcriptional regulator [Salinicola sp. RZ23]